MTGTWRETSLQGKAAWQKPWSNQLYPTQSNKDRERRGRSHRNLTLVSPLSYSFYWLNQTKVKGSESVSLVLYGQRPGAQKRVSKQKYPVHAVCRDSGFERQHSTRDRLCCLLCHIHYCTATFSVHGTTLQPLSNLVRAGSSVRFNFICLGLWDRDDILLSTYHGKMWF